MFRFRLKSLLFLIPVLIIGLAWVVWNNILILDDWHSHTYTAAEAAAMAQLEELSASGSNMADAPQDPNMAPAPDYTPPTKGYHIYINLDIVTMYVYKNGNLIKTYPVSGGKPSTPSPLGTWKIISKDTWGEGFGGAWMGFNVPWGKYGIHGTVYPWFIGKSNSSKGCIRMKNKDVKELFKIVPHGTTVTIVHTNRVFRALKSGDIGTDVKEVQQWLKKLGIYSGYPDGKFGNALKSSVQKFQKAYKINASGTVNNYTYNMIKKKYEEKTMLE